MHTNNIPGWMMPAECRLLRTMFQKYNYTGAVGVEIGSFLGRSAFEISNAIPNGKLYCMDVWDGWAVDHYKGLIEEIFGPTPKIGTKCTLEDFLNNTKNCPNIITKQIRTVESLKDWTETVDFVFLDAAHSNPSDREYIDFWLEKIRPGGLISGHDYEPLNPRKFPDVILNVKYLEDRLNQKVTYAGWGGIWSFSL